MKKHLSISFLLTAIVMTGGFFFGPGAASAEKSSSGGSVAVYYFHGTFRCPTCNKMEQYAREVIENDFKDALTSGKLEFKSVNIEDKENGHYVTDYQLYTKALILSFVKDGKEVRSKNLDKIWQFVRSKERYENYVREEIAAFLKEA